MNLVKFGSVPKEIIEKDKDGVVSRIELDDNWYFLKDFRKTDYNKMIPIISNILKNLKKMRPQFTYTLTIKNAESNYAGGYDHQMDLINISMVLGKYKNEVNLDLPRLVNDNTFIMHGSMYVPIYFLERGLIDKIKNDANKIFSIFLNTVMINIGFDFKTNMVNFRKNGIEMGVFFAAVFADGNHTGFLKSVYSDFGEPRINGKLLSQDQCKLKVLEAMGIEKPARFENINLAQYFDEVVLLDYVKDIFMDYYGVDNFRDMVKTVYEFYKTDVQIDMSDIRNRRIVMAEYLMAPVLDYFRKTLITFSDGKYTDLFQNIKRNCILSDGFRGKMHGEQLFNISLPYITPLVHKVSQHIEIIHSGKIPKPWTSNNPSAMGVLCPISVSAQDMGTNLVATMNTTVNYFGRVRGSLKYEYPVIIPEYEEEMASEAVEVLGVRKGEYLVNSVTGEVISRLTNEEKLDEIK